MLNIFLLRNHALIFLLLFVNELRVPTSSNRNIASIQQAISNKLETTPATILSVVLFFELISWVAHPNNKQQQHSNNITNNRKRARSDCQEQHCDYTASCYSFAILFYELRVPVICTYYPRNSYYLMKFCIVLKSNNAASRCVLIYIYIYIFMSCAYQQQAETT